MTIYDLLARPHYHHKAVLTKLICHHLHLTAEEIFIHYDDTIAPDDLTYIESDYHLYDHDHKPLEYILGYVEFLGRRFAIDERALIPRAETEYMIMAVYEYIQKYAISDGLLMDIGAGCGVLWLSILDQYPQTFRHAYLTDISDDILALESTNLHQYRTPAWTTDVVLVQSDLLAFIDEALLVTLATTPHWLIVANLPYIPDDTFDRDADRGAILWEPRVAFVGWDDGLHRYRQLFDQLLVIAPRLQPHPSLVLFLEMMTRQVEILMSEYTSSFTFEIVKTFHFNIVIIKVQPLQ